MTVQPDVFMPEYALAIVEQADGSEHLCLQIQTASMQFTCLLATQENYRQVADTMAENIRRVGSEMKVPSKLITNVKGLPDGLRKKEGR